MAGVDVGGAAVRGRAQNAELNMIPFIDLLFMMTAFLLITAVWSTNASLPANADVPGSNEGVVDTRVVPKMLHLYNDANGFRLAWKRGDVVLSETTVDKRRVDGSFPDLADAIEKTWRQEGEHRDPGDLKADLAVLHTDDHVAFDEIAASMDAINRTKRELVVGSKSQTVSALSVTFSAR